MTLVYLDTESRCRVDVRKAGAYRYCEDPSFQLLMCAYAIDDEPVQVAVGKVGLFEQMEPLLARYDDPDVMFVAHNTTFDRVAIGTYLGLPPGEYLHPSKWLDPMVLAKNEGLPPSLDKLTKALGVTEKDSAGTRLINLFCKPNKDGEWNDEESHPVQWAEFVAYCGTDVESMREAAALLPAQSAAEREVWIADQLINDRGVRLDLPMAEAAVLADAANKLATRAEVIELTGVENPGSGPQMLEWFSSTGLELTNLTKDTVTEVLTREISPVHRRVLECRQELALASAPAKFKAAVAMACADGRVRGTANYYGAHTGRWCLTGDHEVLTDSGWVRIDEWSGGNIACWNPSTAKISFQRSNQVSFDYSGEMLKYDCTRLQQVSTPDHRMPVRLRSGEFAERTVKELTTMSRPYVLIQGSVNNRASVVDDELRVLVMVQADGHFTEDNVLRLRFSKRRKVGRARRLLRRAGVVYTEKAYSDGATVISVANRAQPLWLSMFRDKQWGPWLWNRNPTVFFEELELWDGYRCGPNSMQYVTTSKNNADIVQAFAHLSGLFARLLEKPWDEDKNWSTRYIVNVWLSPNEGSSVREKPESLTYNGKVYCAETSTGWFLVRRNGSVWVTGNSGRGIQLQNQPRASLGMFEVLAIWDLMNGFGASPKQLKALVRPLLLGPLTIVDYSQIEARVIAWLAGEQWVLDAFIAGRDIYVETARRMGMHDPAGAGRQSGKSANLGLGFGGGPNALTNVGMKGTDEEKELLVRKWRAANPNIQQFWYDMWETFVRGGECGRIKVQRSKGVRRIQLPSGREIVYQGVTCKRVTRESKRTGRPYQAWAMTSRQPSGKVARLWSGTITENIVQGTARDLLARALPELERRGLPTVAHIHDEAIVEGSHLEEVRAVMLDAPSWADGLPIDADGSVVMRYKK